MAVDLEDLQLTQTINWILIPDVQLLIKFEPTLGEIGRNIGSLVNRGCFYHSVCRERPLRLQVDSQVTTCPA